MHYIINYASIFSWHCHFVKVSIRPTGFLPLWQLYNVLKGVLRKKIGFGDFNVLRSRFKAPTSATPNEIDRESVQKRIWVSEWVVTSSNNNNNNKVRNHKILFSSGDKFSSTKNKQNEVGEAMRSSSKQNKNIKL